MADYLPKFKTGSALTLAASADVTGGRLVQISGSKTVAHAVADSASVAGVAGFDAKTGESVTVYPRPTGVHRLVAAGAIAVGTRVIAATDGKVATIGSGVNPIGIAITAAAANNDVVDVLFI